MQYRCPTRRVQPAAEMWDGCGHCNSDRVLADSKRRGARAPVRTIMLSRWRVRALGRAQQEPLAWRHTRSTTADAAAVLVRNIVAVPTPSPGCGQSPCASTVPKPSSGSAARLRDWQHNARYASEYLHILPASEAIQLTDSASKTFCGWRVGLCERRRAH